MYQNYVRVDHKFVPKYLEAKPPQAPDTRRLCRRLTRGGKWTCTIKVSGEETIVIDLNLQFADDIKLCVIAYFTNYLCCNLLYLIYVDIQTKPELLAVWHFVMSFSN